MSKKLKILVIRYRFIGDTILSVPFLRNLRQAYPDAQIDMLVTQSSVGVIAGCPYVDNFVYIDIENEHRYENVLDMRNSFFDYLKAIRKTKYDKAYILKRSLTSALIAFFGGIKERIGFDTE